MRPLLSILVILVGICVIIMLHLNLTASTDFINALEAQNLLRNDPEFTVSPNQISPTQTMTVKLDGDRAPGGDLFAVYFCQWTTALIYMTLVTEVAVVSRKPKRLVVALLGSTLLLYYLWMIGPNPYHSYDWMTSHASLLACWLIIVVLLATRVIPLGIVSKSTIPHQ